MSTRPKVPFAYNKKEEFPAKLAEWIGDVLYDILPEHGYEIRDEQIFTAFQLADAVCNNKVHLAEAGLGTGKTFAYLLTAIAYARFIGKPVVIACASTALQEQLAGPKGDIQTLSNLLGLEIDARMAKDPRQYICDARVMESTDLSDEINQWLDNTKRGERSEMPLVPDQVWKQIRWDETRNCDMCTSRGYCKLIKAREHYRPARDLIIADHGIFFEDLWTREELIEDGKRTILPEYSAVIFDEGHKVILPAAMRAGEHIIREDIDNIAITLEKIQGARNSLISAAVALQKASDNFFEAVNSCIIEDDRSERLALRIKDSLLKAAESFYEALDMVIFELQVEQELSTEILPEHILQVFDIQIERAMLALNRFIKKDSKDVVSWLDRKEESFWVVPRNLSQLLDKHLYQKHLPVVFTSATLSNEGDFSYVARTLGLNKPSHSTVGSPFELEEQVVIYLNEQKLHSNMEKLVALLKENQGRALVLTNSLEEVKKIRKALKDYQFPFEILWEDQGERGYLVQRFREEVSTVLIGANFWEGIDVPGEALTLVVIWQLPFPPIDPLLEVLRKEAKEEGADPMVVVDYPEMGLKLKQGCGRLIRTKDDKGAIVVMEQVKETPWEKIVMGALPPGAKIKALDE